MSTTAWYCYTVARPLSPAVLDGLIGIGGEVVEPVAHGDLVAVTSSVPAAEFAGRGETTDLDWLEAVARAHNTVVDGVARHAAALPFRMATIYRDRDGVLAMLRERAADLEAALDRVTGCAEWGVKVYAEPEAANGSAPAESADTSGRGYLRRRRAERDAGELAQRAAAEFAELLDTELGAVAAGRTLHRPQSRELSGERAANVLNAAYLVPTAATDDFLAIADGLRERAPSCRVDVTGPWAPYSFALDAREPSGMAEA